MLRICLVDDSKFQLMQTGLMLVELGHEVESYQVPKEALASFKTKSYDCLITDLLMPELDGEQLISALKTSGISIPVVVVTANIQKTVEKRCHDLGVDFFLNKPVTKDSIRPVLNRISLTIEKKNGQSQF